MRVPSPEDLFRPTAVPDPEPDPVVDLAEARQGQGSAGIAGGEPSSISKNGAAARAASGRVRHEEKMTVYVTSDELIALEDARLELRRTHRLAVDRGRLVRAAVALALADLDELGADSPLVHRLTEA